MNDELLREYYEQKRRLILDELEWLERLLGTSPRTSQIRKAMKGGLTRTLVDTISKEDNDIVVE